MKFVSEPEYTVEFDLVIFVFAVTVILVAFWMLNPSLVVVFTFRVKLPKYKFGTSKVKLYPPVEFVVMFE